MRFGLFLPGVVLAMAVGGCDNAAELGPRQAQSAQPASAPALTPFIGQPYSALEAGAPQFSLGRLGLTESEQARARAAMAVEQASWMLQGGGAQALVFAGCAQEGCAAGRGIVAIDPSTGSAFVGVRDAAGSTQLRAEPRVETLLELMSPGRSWENAQPPPAPAAP